MYNLADDPAQQINLAGRRESLAQVAVLRQALKKRMAVAGEPVAEITQARLYP